MLRVFSDAGLPVVSKHEDGVVGITIPLPPDDAGRQLEDYLETVAARERSANVASLRPVFAPESVAVIGASRRTGTVGRTVLDNIKAGGYAGQLYAVNPNAVASRRGDRGTPPAPPRARSAASPASPTSRACRRRRTSRYSPCRRWRCVDTAEACGQRGVRGLVGTHRGHGRAGQRRPARRVPQARDAADRPQLLRHRRPSIGLDATFAAANPAAGSVGLVMQSGGIGFAMVDHLTRLGIGISSFASVGNKLDVSSNDMLMWWEQDGQTKVAVLYIESFGNPRKFGRTARRVGLKMPVLTVHAGAARQASKRPRRIPRRSPSPLVSREALFEQAGIIATPSFGELMGATALLATQPPPAGRTVAIVCNVGGAGVLAADACTDLGLAVHHPGGQTRRRLARHHPRRRRRQRASGHHRAHLGGRLSAGA